MTANDSFDQALSGKVVQPLRLAVALASGVDQGQVARRPACQKALFQGKSEFLGNSNPHETRSDHGIVIQNQTCCCIRRN